METIIWILLIVGFFWWIYVGNKKRLEAEAGEALDESGGRFRIENLGGPDAERIPLSRRRRQQKLAPPPSDDFKLESTGVPTTCPTCKTAGKIEDRASGGWRCAVCGETWFD